MKDGNPKRSTISDRQLGAATTSRQSLPLFQQPELALGAGGKEAVARRPRASSFTLWRLLV